ncbi:MSHA biogenesis protein MshP [Vibrio sp. TRT 21S02]|uniref:MSHA biogenesis protein MshP n=1 Tax=Vibrio sp. TRT 21S02 TaxID=3418507 RepID=UPI003CFA630A
MFHNKSKQQGNLYVVVVFTLVVLGFLASTLTRIEWSNNDAFTRDILGNQAWLLAHSANEWALTQMYPLSTVTPDLAVNCSAVSGAVSSVTASSCQAPVIRCESRGALNGRNMYRLESQVTCGSGVFEVRRVQELWVTDE